ncbi:MAG: hypothetical protein AAFY20_06815 [Cyanobacteria bacterium J06639_14]
MANKKPFSAEKRKEKGKKISTPKGESEIPSGKQKPVFSFHYLNRDFCLSCCIEREKAAFADTMHRLSQLTWNEIQGSHKHGLGCEKIQRNRLRSSIPSHITEDVNFLAFRFYGKAPMVGYRDRNIFHVIWFDRAFTLYDHGS